MGRSIFGWDLPPGCTMKDIDDAFGDPPDTLLDFDAHCEKNPKYLDEDEFVALKAITDGSLRRIPLKGIAELIYKVIDWAYEQGRQQGILDTKEAQHYENVNKEALEENK